MTVEAVLAEVKRLAPTLHGAGTFSSRTLEALVAHAAEQPVQRSVETGCGASTLLLSHLSGHHTVFAVDAGTGSVRHTEVSPLLRRDRVVFVEGPTQLTLSRHVFTEPLQLALIDGPHGYPFPDLEYYFIYPHLDPGALLIVDDIHIPTITNLFDFLSADDMFELKDVVETTAFFRRTNAKTFPATEDGWWIQGYNRRAFESVVPGRVAKPPSRRAARLSPWNLDQLGVHSAPANGAHLTISHGEDVVVTGWALDADGQRPAVAVDIVLNGETYRADLRVPRGDVAAEYGGPACLRSGFNARLPWTWFQSGGTTLEVRVVVSGGHEYSAGARFALSVVSRP